MKKSMRSRIKLLLNNLKEKLSYVFRIAINIASILLIFSLLKWSGVKGLIMFLAGMAIMAYLILSGNAMIKIIEKAFTGEINLLNPSKDVEDNEDDKEKD